MAHGLQLARSHLVMSHGLSWIAHSTEVYRMTQEQPAQGVALGTQAPNFSLTTSDGERVSLGDFRGRQPVLLVFYRGWW